MKFPKIILVFAIIIGVSCDKNEKIDPISPLLAHWHVWDFEPSSSSSKNGGLVAKEAILNLVETGCDPLEFTFRADRTVIYKDGMRFIDVADGETGETVACAATYEVLEGTFDFDGTTLNLNFEQKSSVRAATVEGDFLRVTVNDLEFNNQILSGDLVYKIETGE